MGSYNGTIYDDNFLTPIKMIGKIILLLLILLFIVIRVEEVDVTISDLMMNVIEDEDLPECEEYIWERNGENFIPSSIGLSEVEAKLRL